MPQDHHEPLLAYAEEHGKPLTAAMFVRRTYQLGATIPGQVAGPET